MKSGNSSTAKPILNLSITAEAEKDMQTFLKGPEEMNLTFTFVFTITLEPIWAFTAIILQIIDTTTKI